MSDPKYEATDYYIDDAPDDWDEEEYECGLRRDGQCGMAGSEYCDFSCPMQQQRVLRWQQSVDREAQQERQAAMTGDLRERADKGGEDA